MTTEAMLKIRHAKRGLLVFWTVYDRPKDHPDGFIARRFEVGHDGPVAAADTLTGSLEEIREMLSKAGLLKISRQPEDEPQIVENWL